MAEDYCGIEQVGLRYIPPLLIGRWVFQTGSRIGDYDGLRARGACVHATF